MLQEEFDYLSKVSPWLDCMGLWETLFVDGVRDDVPLAAPANLVPQTMVNRQPQTLAF